MRLKADRSTSITWLVRNSAHSPTAHLSAADTVAERDRPLRAPEELALLDRIIHERVRLGIVCALALGDSLTFNELKRFLGVTEGNLSTHAQKLEAAGYVSCAKSFEGRIPCTRYRITTSGRQALGRHLEHLSAVIRWASR